MLWTSMTSVGPARGGAHRVDPAGRAIIVFSEIEMKCIDASVGAFCPWTHLRVAFRTT
jgi:hypothetical protein